MLGDFSTEKGELLGKIEDKFARKKEDDVTMLLCERK